VVLGGWSAVGIMAFLADINQAPETLAAMSEAHRNLYEARPSWAFLAYATAVFGGLLGGVALLMRRKFAAILFIISLLGLILQNYYSFGVAKVQEIYPASVIILPAIVVVIAILLIWFSRSATAKKWLK
jgi:tryptophan-rich sensory protein